MSPPLLFMIVVLVLAILAFAFVWVAAVKAADHAPVDEAIDLDPAAVRGDARRVGAENAGPERRAE